MQDWCFSVIVQEYTVLKIFLKFKSFHKIWRRILSFSDWRVRTQTVQPKITISYLKLRSNLETFKSHIWKKARFKLIFNLSHALIICKFAEYNVCRIFEIFRYVNTMNIEHREMYCRYRRIRIRFSKFGLT